MSIGGSIFNRSLDVPRRRPVDEGRQPVLSASASASSTALSLFYGYTNTKSQYQVYPAARRLRARASRPTAYADYIGKTSSITPGYRYDSRNDPFDPTRGKTFGFSIDDRRRAARRRLLVRQAGRRGAPRTSRTGRTSHLAVNLEGGFIRAYNGTEIPIFERFRIGGDRSVRGFQYGAIFPLDDDDTGLLHRTGRAPGRGQVPRLQRRVGLLSAGR